MCGIFGFLSASQSAEAFQPEEIFGKVEALLNVPLAALVDQPQPLRENEEENFVRTLTGAHAAAYRWMQADAFLAARDQAAIKPRLWELLTRVESWVLDLEGLASGTGLKHQRERELVNRFLVGGKDIAWQLSRDFLGNLDGLAHLAGSFGLNDSPRVLGHLRQLQLVLSSLNRLEVRGRDSAGIAVYVRFAEADSLDSCLVDLNVRNSVTEELENRLQIRGLVHRAIVRPDCSDRTLLFVFKVANEIGSMGDNVAYLRRSIREDVIFQRVLRWEDVDIQCLAHTRWASNGIISLANCHPVDSAICPNGNPGQPGRDESVADAGDVVAVLNGDIDNYQQLLDLYVGREHSAFDGPITTDAKIIPIAVRHHYRRTGDFLEAFRAAFAEFEGSMAIGAMAADRPGEFLFGQKGSGQGLFLGISAGGVAVASEMYGLVEYTNTYVKANGERQAEGEIFRVRRAASGVAVELCTRQKQLPVSRDRYQCAEITTRDINRGEHPHFLVKEIEESVESVRKTMLGKFDVDDDGVRSLLGPDVIPEDLPRRIRSGELRRIVTIGQGTAAVAAEGVAHLLDRALSGGEVALQVSAMKATELSGHHLADDMSDTLVVAISQSGTTTDTNRTVDMARERGAIVIGIVNRRNSDLVYKSDGVLYTSDGRDIEMSVASTKAFYAQNVAGQVLALALAIELDTLTLQALRAELSALQALPEAMRATLELAPHVKDLAERFAPRRRYWAVVGSGPTKVAADEIRIKLSELCYKSIAADFLEDKKHIDLSSEPLVLVCANQLPPATVSDVVKEVAIFKAHDSIPIVITEEGESRFDPYAAGTIALPAHGGNLGYLLATMVGHLFGYYAAWAFDNLADLLRRLRSDVFNASAEATSAGEDAPGTLSPQALRAQLGEKAMAQMIEIDELLLEGSFDSGVDARTAVRLGRALDFLLGRLSADDLGRRRASAFDTVVNALADAINELSRPIDAIKHQAKTVTVGISRGDESAVTGKLLSTFPELSLPLDCVAETHRRFLVALDPLVEVDGASLYRVDGLDPLGRPTDKSTIRLVRRIGSALDITSRCSECQPLTGTKWGVVKTREFFLGFGETDERRILVVPVAGENPTGHVLLYQLSVARGASRQQRLNALRLHERRLERLQIAVTERNTPWREELIDAVDEDTLFFAPPETTAAEMVNSVAVEGGE